MCTKRTFIIILLAVLNAALEDDVVSAANKPTEIQKLGLELHNKYRAIHNSPPLTLDDALNKEADAHAEDYAKRKTVDNKWMRWEVFENANYMSYSPYFSRFDLKKHIELAVKTWYNNIDGYDFSKGDSDWSTDKFVQIVCAQGKKLGIGAKRLDNFTVVVAIYAPRACQEKAERIKYVLKPKKSISGPVVKPTDYQLMGLSEHNRYRALHNSPPLVLDDELNKEAEANAADYARRGEIDNEWGREGLGENLHMIMSWPGMPVQTPVAIVKEAVSDFYAEIGDWDFEKPKPDFVLPNGKMVGRFVQMICTKTKRLGIGAQELKGTTVIAAVYDPHGCDLTSDKADMLKKVPRPKTGPYSKPAG